jgi:hypothetical protein
MLSQDSCRRAPRRRAAKLTLAFIGAAGFGSLAHASDPVVFSFATVGDSRQDPSAPDPTTLQSGSPSSLNLAGTLLPADRQWLQNNKATTRILRSIVSEKPNLLFFNGDMIFGYGRPVPPITTGTGSDGAGGAAVTGTPLWTATYPGATSGFSANSTSATVGPDFTFYYTQYAYWRGLFANLFETGTYVVPVAGNHETQCNNTKPPYSKTTPNPNCASGTHAYTENETMFRNNMGDLIMDLALNERFQNVSNFEPMNPNGLLSTNAAVASPNNGPITGNQAEMSYSFDIQTAAGLLHFAIVNTDPSGADSTAPAGWLATDFASAQSRGAVKFFVFGHKPVFTYNYGVASGVPVAAGGLDAGPSTCGTSGTTPCNQVFWSVIAQYNATYFCGHEHIVNVAAYADPTGASTNKPYQVIVGSGGSPFDDALIGTCSSGTFTTPGQTCHEPAFTNPGDRFYAWAFVQVHQSGTVTLSANGFSDTFGPTQTLYTVPAL